MRITGGQWQNRKLVTLHKQNVRPTAARVRQAIFDVLGSVQGQSVLDVCCGTGALAFEALSRGAGHTILVDIDITLAKQNVENLGAEAVVLKKDLRRLKGVTADLIFCDPPYGEIGKVLYNIILEKASTLLNDSGTLVLEHNSYIDVPESLRLITQKKYGDTFISFLEKQH